MTKKNQNPVHCTLKKKKRKKKHFSNFSGRPEEGRVEVGEGVRQGQLVFLKAKSSPKQEENLDGSIRWAKTCC